MDETLKIPIVRTGIQLHVVNSNSEGKFCVACVLFTPTLEPEDMNDWEDDN